jgi:hypothetical protein
MEKVKTSKKALRGLINDSIQEALKSLQLPAAGKKAGKVVEQNAKKLASIYADVIKRENKKIKKAAKFMEDAVKGKSRKGKKSADLKIEKSRKMETV